MFCPNCGTKIEEGIFCPACGTKVVLDAEPVQVQPSQAPAYSAPVSQPVQPASAPVKKPIKKIGLESVSYKLIGGIGIAIIAVIALILFLSLRKGTIDMNKFVNVEFSGYENNGRASATIDWDAFNKAYGKKLKINKKAVKKLVSNEGYKYISDLYGINIEAALDLASTEVFKESVYGHLDNSSHLATGDVVTYTWDCEDQVLELFNYKVKYSDKEFKVSGLEKAGTFNPFDGITVSYSGKSPNGNANYECDYSREEYSSINYKFSKREGLSNGDVITMTASISGSEDSFIERYGVVPNPTEQEFVVEGLMETVTKGDMITENQMSTMQSQAQDIINATAARDWDDSVRVKALDYLGYYLLVSKGNAYKENVCTLVYKITPEATMDTKDDGIVIQDYEVYYYVSFSNLLIDENGEGVVDISNTDVTYESFKIDTGYEKADGWWNYEYYFKGFDNLDKLYNEVVTKNIESYSHEDHVEN